MVKINQSQFGNGPLLVLLLFRCSSSSRDESDYRPLFENFLHDLFITANLPEWPASEVLLTQLGHLFVVTFSNTKLEMSLRTSALDYLSQIAAHLRKAALKSEAKEEKEKLHEIVDIVRNCRQMINFKTPMFKQCFNLHLIGYKKG